jgi:hypothetical protein
MHWNDFFVGVIVGWISSLAITVFLLYCKLKSYENDDDED